MAENTRIKPELAAGIKDYLPKDMIPRQWMLDTIREVFELFGFVPLDTPGLERIEILTGGDPDFDKQIFRVGLKENDEDLALRFDLTVPLARVVAQYAGKITKPFKRYQVGKVWRGEKPQAGRFREFVQFDADIVGSARTAADAEIIALMHETMVALRVERFLVRFNNRKVLNGLPEYANFDPSKIVEVLHLIDKLDRLGWDNIAGEMADLHKISATALSAIKEFLELRTGTAAETISALRRLMSRSAIAMEGVDELAEIVEHLDPLGVPKERWTIDLSVARGLGYYTGPVFETTMLDLPSIGSVFSGGRFDGLVSRFGGDIVPATGASVGVDRLFAALEKLGQIQRRPTISQVCVLNFDPEGARFCQEVTTILRRAGISTEFYLGKGITLREQLAYAVSQEFPICVIIGATERQRQMVKIKDMTFRQQFDLPPNGKMVTKIQQILKLLCIRRQFGSIEVGQT